MLTINRTRFLDTLNTIAQIGLLSDDEGGGRDRRPFSPAEREARRYFTEQAEAAGLTVTTDAAANLSARLSCGPANAKTLLLGSHLDTVPNGGPYDGALGVISALEVLRVVAEQRLSLPFDLEAIAFADEEGRFGDFFGSRSLADRHSDATVETFFARAEAYPDDLAAMSELVSGGVTRQGLAQAVRDPETLAGYLELHIEQGPRLEHAGLAIGVVSAIFGRSSFKLTFVGRPDHAGTTPMDLRADALVAAGQFVTRAPTLVRETFPEAVITCGGISVEPGVYNVVPGRVTLLVEFRAATQVELSGIDDALQEIGRGDRFVAGSVTCYRANELPCAGAHGSGHAGGDSPGIQPARPRLHGSALGRRPRCPGDGRHHAGGHALRAFQGRAQPLPRGGYGCR